MSAVHCCYTNLTGREVENSRLKPLLQLRVEFGLANLCRSGFSRESPNRQQRTKRSRCQAQNYYRSPDLKVLPTGAMSHN